MRDEQREPSLASAFAPRCLEVTCGAVATQARDVCPGAWRCAEHGVFFVTAKTEPEPMGFVRLDDAKKRELRLQAAEAIDGEQWGEAAARLHELWLHEHDSGLATLLSVVETLCRDME